MAEPTLLKKKIILVDMDDTICDLENTVRYILRDEFKVDINNDQRIENVSKEYTALSRTIVGRKGFYRNLPPIPDVIKALKEMNEEYDVYICTSPLKEYKYCVSEKFAWIDEYLPEFNRKIYMCKDKTLIRGDILIDDRLQEGILKPEWTQVIFHQPFNTQLRGKRLIEWNKWREIFKPM